MEDQMRRFQDALAKPLDALGIVAMHQLRVVGELDLKPQRCHFPLPKSPRVTRCHAATISAFDRPNSLSNSGGTWQPERPGGTPRFDGQYPRPVLARVSTNSRRRAPQSAASACGSGCGSSTALGERAASNFSPFCTQVSHAASMLANRLPFFRWCERKRSTSRSMRGSLHAARLTAYCRPRGLGSQSSGTNLFAALASAGGLLASGETLSLTPFRGVSFLWVWVLSFWAGWIMPAGFCDSLFSNCL